MLINTNSNQAYNPSQTLYIAYTTDLTTQFSLYYLPFMGLIQLEFQDTLSTVILLAPELVSMFNDYVNTFVLPNTFNYEPTAVFDSYIDNFQMSVGFSNTYSLFYFIYIWGLVIFVALNIILR